MSFLRPRREDPDPTGRTSSGYGAVGVVFALLLIGAVAVYVLWYFGIGV